MAGAACISKVVYKRGEEWKKRLGQRAGLCVGVKVGVGVRVGGGSAVKVSLAVAGGSFSRDRARIWNGKVPKSSSDRGR
jgi:hypothetical protein